MNEQPPTDAPKPSRHLPSERGRPERILHAPVPAHLFRKAHVAAANSGMRFREYLCHLLNQAEPIPFDPQPNE